MTLFKTALRGLAATAILAGTTVAGLAQDVTLKMHYFLPEQAIVPKMALKVWSDKVEAESNGRIKIQHFPSMQLGGTPPQLAEQVVDGVADIVWTLPGYTPGRFPSSEVFELPFIASDPEATSQAFYEYAEENMLETELVGMHLLAAWVHGPGVIHSKEPIQTIEDLNGVKLRAPTRVTNEYFGELGATPIGMPVPAVPEALSKGVIDATVLPWEVTTSLKIAELVNNHTEFPDATLYVATMIFAMNEAKYESLPDDLKKVIDDNSGLAFSAFAGNVMAQGDEIGRKMAVDHGNNIIQLSPEQVEAWKAAGAPVEENWIAEMDGKGMDGAAMVQQARDLIAKYTK